MLGCCQWMLLMAFRSIKIWGVLVAQRRTDHFKWRMSISGQRFHQKWCWDGKLEGSVWMKSNIGLWKSTQLSRSNGSTGQVGNLAPQVRMLNKSADTITWQMCWNILKSNVQVHLITIHPGLLGPTNPGIYFSFSAIKQHFSHSL